MWIKIYLMTGNRMRFSNMCFKVLHVLKSSFLFRSVILIKGSFSCLIFLNLYCVQSTIYVWLVFQTYQLRLNHTLYPYIVFLGDPNNKRCAEKRPVSCACCSTCENKNESEEIWRCHSNIHWSSSFAGKWLSWSDLMF